MEQGFVDTLISPEGKLEVLSKAEVNKLLDSGKGGLYTMFRNCALAVLNCGSTIDDGKELLERYKSFEINIIQRERGIKLDNRGHALTLSAEAGYPFAVGNGWVVEPQAQIIHQKISLDTQDDGISKIEFDSDSAWTGRLGARLKGRYLIGDTPVEPYLRANVWHTFSGTDTVTFDNAQRIETEQRASTADLGAGVIVSLAPTVSAYAGVDYGNNLDSNQQRSVAGNVGVRISW